MRTIPIAAAALVVLSTAAFAQMSPSRDNTTTPAPRTSTSAPAATAPAPRVVQINPLTQDDVSKIEGTSVYGGDDGKIGRVSHVLMDPQSKKIDKLVVSAGGFVGIGSHRVALPLDQFSWDADKGGFKLSMTLAKLKEQPEWVEGGTMTGSSTPPKNSAPSSAGDSNR